VYINAVKNIRNLKPPSLISPALPKKHQKNPQTTQINNVSIILLAGLET